MSDLYSRIKSIGRGKKSAAPSDAKPAREDESPDYIGLDSWTRVADHVFLRETIDDSVKARASSITSRLMDREVTFETMRFMDTETTGLSGGAGTTVFLVGSGTLTMDGMVVRQLLLGDFPAEPAYLESISRDLSSDIWVSYNGKAFDSRLLESRFLMNGMPPLAAYQLDLLYWARRLWKRRLDACTLGRIEDAILLRGREDDIPGIEIPDRYFQFVATRDASHLEEVFEHHRLDIVSLGHLFLRIERILEKPDRDFTIDRFQLGRWMIGGNDERGLDLLSSVVHRDAADEMDGETDEAAERRIVAAAAVMGRTYRRTGRFAEAKHIYEDALARCPASLAALVALAKVLEHDLRDPESALSLIDGFLETQNGEPGEELIRRRERLERRAAKARAPQSSRADRIADA